MPTFYTENIDIEVEEFLDDCDSNEIQEVIQWLKDNGEYADNRFVQDDAFDDALTNLMGKRFKLTTEQENIIMNISKNIV